MFSLDYLFHTTCKYLVKFGHAPCYSELLLSRVVITFDRLTQVHLEKGC